MNYSVNQHQDGGACLTVVECGAEHGSDATRDGVMDASARALILQQLDEAPAELAVRAAHRVARLTCNGTALEAGLIITSDAASEDLLSSRCQIARAMIRAMRGAIAPRLIFVAPSTISDAGRHELFSIAGTLATQLRGTSVEVSVRFVEPRSVSGLHPVPAPFKPAHARVESHRLEPISAEVA